jgi:signal transduction histidine kinase
MPGSQVGATVTPMSDRPSPRRTQPWHARTDAIHPIDVAVAVGLAALPLVSVISGAGSATPDGLTVVLLLLESLPLILRRRFPLEVFLVVVTATIVQLAIVPAGQEFLGGLGILVAFYTVGERLDRQLSIPLVALAGVIAGVVLLGRGGFPTVLQSVVQTELILAVAWLVGDASRIRHLYTQALEEQARLLEREREERTQRAILEERERIARELHDVVAHHASVVVVQAGGALRALDTRPEEARSALEAIAATGRQALTEMRRLVGVLGGHDGDPMPRLADLDALVEQVRAAGLTIDLEIEGDRRSLDPGLELSAYRIVQEGLTNSLKYAGGGRTIVTVRFGTEALGITIDDEHGPDQAAILESVHDGRGLIGMRERVAMFRGTFEAAPTSTGFRVDARLPIDDSAVAGAVGAA